MQHAVRLDELLSIMVLTILLAWLALGALAVLFAYCCSRVSSGPRSEFTDDDFTTDPLRPVDTVVGHA